MQNDGKEAESVEYYTNFESLNTEACSSFRIGPYLRNIAMLGEMLTQSIG